MPMSLEEKLEKEFREALKAKNSVKVSTIRMLKAGIYNFKLDKNINIATDGDILKIIDGQIKQHKDSIEQFEKGNRQDLVEKEKQELAILKSYMPEELPEEELKKIITDTISELGATGKRDMGKVIKSVMEKTKGRAEGRKVSQLVSVCLNISDV